MNENRNAKRKANKLVITINEHGLKVNKQTDLPELLNVILRALLSLVTIIANTQEAKKETYDTISTAFANFLAAYAPEYYFPSREELTQELADEAASLLAKVDMGLGKDIDFEKLKKDQLPKIEEARKYAEEHPDQII